MHKNPALSVAKVISSKLGKQLRSSSCLTPCPVRLRKFATSSIVNRQVRCHRSTPKIPTTSHSPLPTCLRHRTIPPAPNLPSSKHPIHSARRHYSEYERPFSYFKGVLDSFLVGSRRNYVRPSVTYAAGLGNTALRHVRLHVDDYTHAIPAHHAFIQYLKAVVNRRPSLIFSTLTMVWLLSVYNDFRHANEIYDNAVDSIFALKAKNFLIKQGEKIFLETVLIMFYEGVLEPLEIEGESSNAANARFVGEIQSMLAEIERHRDFRLSNIPLNFLEIGQEKEQQPWLYQLEVWVNTPWVNPLHKKAEEERASVETDTPVDIYREQRALIEPTETPSSFVTKLDSSGVGSLYGLFYPLITRYHHIPTELSVQAVPLTMQRGIRDGSAPLTKLLGRNQDAVVGSPLVDQFQLDHRNEEEAMGMRLNIRNNLPKYWESEVDRDIYNSYYLQRTANLIKRCRDVDFKVASSMFGENNIVDLLKTYLNKADRILLNNIFSSNLHHFSPGDSHLFRYYYKKYNLVPYLNSLQYEMSELTVLRQRLVRMGRAVGIDAELESLSPEVLDLFDPYRTKPAPSLRPLSIDLGNGQTRTIGTVEKGFVETTADTRYITPGASDSFESRSILTTEYIELTDKHSNFANDNRWTPKLPAPRTNSVESLYTPVKIHNLVESITEHQYNIKGLTLLVDSLHHAQHTETPQLYPCLGTHPMPISQEKFYVNSLFNPLQNAFGVSSDEKYLRGLLGCIDVTLLRNAAEYQRWVYLVPKTRRGIIGQIIELLRLNNKDYQQIKKEGYLDRDALPEQIGSGYDGNWVPFSTKDEVVHRKPIYHATQVGEEGWGEWFYRIAGLRSTKPFKEYASTWAWYVLGYPDEPDDIAVDHPFMPHVRIESDNVMRNSLEYERLKQEEELKANSLGTQAKALLNALATRNSEYVSPHLRPENIEIERQYIKDHPHLPQSSDNPARDSYRV